MKEFFKSMPMYDRGLIHGLMFGFVAGLLNYFLDGWHYHSSFAALFLFSTWLDSKISGDREPFFGIKIKFWTKEK